MIRIITRHKGGATHNEIIHGIRHLFKVLTGPGKVIGLALMFGASVK